jgi:hypothetical protein
MCFSAAALEAWIRDNQDDFPQSPLIEINIDLKDFADNLERQDVEVTSLTGYPLQSAGRCIC